ASVRNEALTEMRKGHGQLKVLIDRLIKANYDFNKLQEEGQPLGQGRWNSLTGYDWFDTGENQRKLAIGNALLKARTAVANSLDKEGNWGIAVESVQYVEKLIAKES